MTDPPRVAGKSRKAFWRRRCAHLPTPLHRLGMAVAVGTALALGVSGAASADWLDQVTPIPAGATTWSLSAVSCTSPTRCEAVGGSGSTADGLLAESRNGTTWTVQAMPDPGGASLNGISCTAASACTAVGEWVDGATTVTLAERWNGSSWSVQSTPSPSGASSSALGRVSCVSATNCVAVGDSYNGTVTSTLAETWNGTSWTIRSTPNVGGQQTSQLNGVSCTSVSACTAVGYSATASTGQPLAEAWNGATWSIQTTPSPSGSTYSQLNGVSCTSTTACTAVGDGFAEVWNGTSWSVQTIARTKDNLSSVSCVATSSHCTAVGGYYREGIQYMVAESRTGTKWSQNTVPLSTSYDTDLLSDVSCQNPNSCTAVGTYHDPVDGDRALAEVLQLRWQPQVAAVPTGALATGLQTVSCTAAKACMAVGNYEGGGSTFYALAESWNGGSWTVQNVPDATGTDFSGVSCTAANACTVVGDAVSGGDLVTLAERWNGTSWSVQSTPSPAGAVDSYLTSVSCTSATACTAVGFGTDGSGHQTLLTESWNGSTWTMHSTPDPSGSTTAEFNTVSCASAAACVAVGYYLSPSYTVLAEVWNGTSWTMHNPALPSGGSDGYLSGVSCPAATMCAAVGNYYNGSKIVTLAERWNGSGWAIQPTPNREFAQDSYLDSVSCVSATSCTATGAVHRNGPVSLLTLAERWDGTRWHLDAPGAPSGALSSVLSGVSCKSGNDCMAVGYYNDSSDTELPLAAPFN